MYFYIFWLINVTVPIRIGTSAADSLSDSVFKISVTLEFIKFSVVANVYVRFVFNDNIIYKNK